MITAIVVVMVAIVVVLAAAGTLASTIISGWCGAKQDDANADELLPE